MEGAVTLNPSLAVSERYSDNLFFTKTNREADFTTMITPGLTLMYNSRNLVFSGRYQGSAELLAGHPEANRYGQAVSLDLNLPLLSHKIKGLDVRITETMAFTPELPAFSFDEQVLANEGIQIGRTDIFRNNAQIIAGYPWSPRVNTTLSYSNILTHYKGDRFQDSVGHDTSLEIGYQWSPRTRWRTSYGISITDYETADDVLAHRFSMGAVHQVSPTFSINGDTGMALLSDETTHLILNMGFSKGFESGSLSLQYTSGVGTGGGLITSATLSQRLVGQATREIRRNTSALFRLAYGRNTSLLGPMLEIYSYEAGMGITVGFLSWLKGDLNYSYLNQQVQEGTVGEGKRNLIMMTLTATAPPWRIIQ